MASAFDVQQQYERLLREQDQYNALCRFDSTHFLQRDRKWNHSKPGLSKSRTQQLQLTFALFAELNMGKFQVEDLRCLVCQTDYKQFQYLALVHCKYHARVHY